MSNRRYDYNTFKELFDSHIQYAYEGQYGCSLGTEDHNVEYAEFYKLYLNSEGTGQYKVDNFTFDPRLWPQVKLLAEMLTETPAEKILFKVKPELDEP
jgi:hypothetical protein